MTTVDEDGTTIGKLMPLLKSKDDCQHLFLYNGIPGFRVSQSTTGIGDWSAILEQSTSQTIVASITLNDQLLTRVKVNQSGCLSEELFESCARAAAGRKTSVSLGTYLAR